MTSSLDAFLTRADIADIALLICALSSTAGLAMCFRELIAANRRFDAFVRALADFNRAANAPTVTPNQEENPR